MFSIIGEGFVTKSECSNNQVQQLVVENTIDSCWKEIAGLLNLKLISPLLSLYENESGTYILSQYGFVKQIK